MWRFVKKEILLWLFFLLTGTAGFFFTITLPQTEGFYAFLLTTSLAGFGIAFYIYYGKRYQKQLACPTGESCNEVVNSAYSKLFGIPVEYMGMLYYLTMILTYGFFTQTPAFSSYAPLAVLLSTLAFLFSVYLTGVQAFILNRWCIWCLLSGALSRPSSSPRSSA